MYRDLIVQNVESKLVTSFNSIFKNDDKLLEIPITQINGENSFTSLHKSLYIVFNTYYIQVYIVK